MLFIFCELKNKNIPNCKIMHLSNLYPLMRLLLLLKHDLLKYNYRDDIKIKFL